MTERVDYDALAEEYDRRYEGKQRQGTAVSLLALAREVGAGRVLEVGCGTGHWLMELGEVVAERFGLDFSRGMLGRAAQRGAALRLVQGRAQSLPFAAATFDLVFCVNAIHHFDNPRRFVEEAYRLLRPGGALAVVGMEPHGRKERWYVYDYFEGVYERDLARFPSWREVEQWLALAGFTGVRRRVVEQIVDNVRGRAVLDDPFLRKHSCSQLALLDESAYVAGIRRLKAALARAEAAGEALLFRSEIELSLLSGWRRAESLLHEPGPSGVSGA